MVSRQPSYTEPRYATQRSKSTGQYERGPQAGTLRRIGHNPETGLGQFPSPSGVLREARRIHSQRVVVSVYGVPGWDPTARTSPKPDKAGRVWINAFVSQAELEDALAQRGQTFELGRRGGDPAMADVVMELTGYNFRDVYTIELWPA
jgi:hypothetical protein